jgi:hypothetical protein
MFIKLFRFTAGNWRAGAWASSRVTACDWLVGRALSGLGMSRHRGWTGVACPNWCCWNCGWSCCYWRVLATMSYCMVMLPSIVCAYAWRGFICLWLTGIWFSYFSSIDGVFRIVACIVQWLMDEDVPVRILMIQLLLVKDIFIHSLYIILDFISFEGIKASIFLIST